MKTTDIKIGSVYDLKVGKNTTPVRIMKAAEKGGWEAVTLTGSKPVAIKSADRLVGLHSPKKAPTSAQGAKAGPKPTKTASQAKKATQSKRGPTSPKVKRASAPDSAVRVLSEAKGPMTCQQLIETMAAKGYWKSTGGKTPQNTLYAAIAKEIHTKGKDSRFQKVGRGQFTLKK
ncbi:MAG: winged helix-turn-helix domain-containing protein [Sedimentisphaerales bacterium]|nr:winged helix-turn-helix domain-containing protein [Sedimentisphaerales bacterium]